MDEERGNSTDYEEVLRVLSKSFQDTWKDNPDVLVYLSELGSLGLHQLTQEPVRLSEEKTSVLEQTQDLAFHNYKTFIQAAECSQKIFEDFSIIETRLDSLLNKLPTFKEKCISFGKEAQGINARWKQASSTLTKHQQLLEFLEMPQIMENFVKAGFYDEALELSAYVKRLERKHSEIPLIESITKSIQASANLMLSQLLGKLQTNIQLPECLKIVGYLRRMDVFNEIELRIKFLQARDTWFKAVINEIDRNDPYQHVIKVIESSRIHLFDIITQYRAIFSDDDPLLLISDNSKSNCAVFHSWMTIKISWFLKTLEKDISLNLGGRIDSVFAQCMYFGLSFSRVNIDFRPLLVPIFQNVIFNKFKSEIDIATQKFSKTMISFIFSSYTNTALLVSSLSEDYLQAPINLLDFHPLAQYCNNILSALNELKLCCSFSMASDVTKLLTDSLNTVVKVLVGIFYQKKNIMNDQSKDHFYKFCSLFSLELIPHLNKCLVVLFPSEEISQLLGISAMEFKKFDYMYKLNILAIMKPLEDILPVKDDDEGIVLNIKSSLSDALSSNTLENSMPEPVDDLEKFQTNLSINKLEENIASKLVFESDIVKVPDECESINKHKSEENIASKLVVESDQMNSDFVKVSEKFSESVPDESESINERKSEENIATKLVVESDKFSDTFRSSEFILRESVPDECERNLEQNSLENLTSKTNESDVSDAD